MELELKKTSENLFLYAVLAAFFALGLYRLIGYYYFDIPYGYDPGFFKHAILTYAQYLPELPGSDMPSFVASMHEPLFGIITDILMIIGYSPDFIIGPLLGILSIFTSFFIYSLLKQLSSRNVGLIGIGLFLVSIVQYQEFWWNYWRNILGIIFLLSSLLFIYKRSPLLIITSAALFTIHRPSALFFAVMCLFYFIVEAIQTKKWPLRVFSYVLGGGVLALPLYKDQMGMLTDLITPVLTTISIGTKSGTFYSSNEFFFLILPYFLLLVPAIFFKINRKQFDLVFIGFLVGLAWSILRLFFYNRMFVFFDIFIILMAAYSVGEILLKSKKIYVKILVVIVISFQVFSYVKYVNDHKNQHAISKKEFDIITNFNILLPNNATILSTHKYYTPWLLGYSGRKVLAPGMLENQIWDEEKWKEFYFESSPEKKCLLISDYRDIANPLYVFVGNQQPELSLNASCFKPIIGNNDHYVLYEVLYR